ncbi:OprO/OprP family phosphate-selective porin [Planctomicrobium piriforme]|uniref:OprO/OprP family phosphate-selective porin n=1 Tax=Planctomicrobium piriforme TaxID=1576369 RepID=UPI001587A44E|nr:porin [Planctomicrobium piriforme]
MKPDYTIRLRGRIDTDAIWSSQSPANLATFGDLQDVVGLRRARIGIEGELGRDARYVAEIDLPTGTIVPRDIYLALGDPQGGVEGQFGHFREPFSLEGGTSARYFAFMERSPVNMLDPARNWGVGLFHENLTANSAWGLGVFHAGTDTADFQGGDGSTVGLTSRFTMALVNEGDGERLLHLGLALSERVPENGVIVINQQPRSSLLELADSSTSPFVPEIRIPATFQQLANLQLAAAQGPLWTQAEWYGSLIDQTGGGPVFFHGCHVDGGYFLTGEHRAYNSSSGTLGAVRVNRPLLCSSHEDERRRGWGAWELTARFTYLDFVDADTPAGPGGQPLGIQLPLSTFGANWYLSDRVRVMFNYSYAVSDDAGAGSSTANIFATRLGVFW